MIVEQIVNERLVKQYSDAGKFILQVETGIEYPEAVDVIPCRYTYKETDRDIEVATEETEEPTAEEEEVPAEEALAELLEVLEE